MFLGQHLKHCIDDCFSEHEPDLFEGFNFKTLKRIQKFGFYHMVIGRLQENTGIRILNEKFTANEISFAAAAQSIRRHRDKYFRSFEANLIIESYYQWYGLLSPLRNAFPNSKIVAIIRDPRDWVKSWMNYGGHFDKSDMVEKLGFSRINPSRAGDKEYEFKWEQFGQFEKLCWHWQHIYTMIDNHNTNDPQSIIFRFEDLFDDKNSIQTTEKLLNFCAEHSNRSFTYDVEKFHSFLPENKSNPKNVQSWSKSEKAILEEICGPLFQKYYCKQKVPSKY